MKMGKLEKLFVNRTGHSQRVSRRAERVLSHTDPRPGQRYLDVGTGNGKAAIDMAVNHRLEVTGIDIDREQVRLAQAAADGIQNVQFMTLDGRDLPFADGAFDIVSAFKVTHHIADWQEAVEEMIRVLRVGGYFVYADLIVPESVAALGTKFIKGVGFPTVAGLTRVVEANGLFLMHATRGAVHYESVYRKGAGRE